MQSKKNKTLKSHPDNLNLKNKLDISSLDQFDIDNSYFPFIPKIKKKPHAIDDLNKDISDARRLRMENLEKIKNLKFEDHKESKDIVLFTHPYKKENEVLMDIVRSKMDQFNKIYRDKYQVEGGEYAKVMKFEKIKLEDLLKHGLEVSLEKHEKNDKLHPSFNKYSIGDFKNLNIEEILKVSNSIKEKQINSYQSNFFSQNDDTACMTLDIEKLMINYEIEYLPLESTRFIFVDTLDSLMQMINEIETYATEIAVDLEHHSLESYLGITCLMQISTRFTDYIVDTIKLRSSLQELNRVFCNPQIVKVLHGADYDIEWLQKDFGLYIVNMFDTGLAARNLSFTSFSLAYLLSSICNITADKKYQLADWRIRPLPSEMIKYAREDTHYLLYIYDVLRKKLIEKSVRVAKEPTEAWLNVCHKSFELTLKQYSKPCLKSYEYYQILSRNTHLSILKKSLLKLIYKFRDYVARKLDVSGHLVLPTRVMFNLVKENNFNTETIFSKINEGGNTHCLIRNFVPDLVKLIDQKLLKNERKIEQGGANKIFESNYLENMRNKFNESKMIASKVTVKLNSKLEKSSGVISNSIDASKEPVLKLDDVKKIGDQIFFTQKCNSKFINHGEFEETKQNQICNNTDKTGISNKQPVLEEYENLVNSFNKFNIISFLKEKHPNLNIKIEVKSVKSQGQQVLTDERDSKILSEPSKAAKASTQKNMEVSDKEEIFLNQKRRADTEIPMLDLTDYKRTIQNQGKKEYKFKKQNSDSNEDSDEDEDEMVKQMIMQGKSNTSKNIQEKEKFIQSKI
jgi:ribonuclease D